MKLLSNPKARLRSAGILLTLIAGGSVFGFINYKPALSGRLPDGRFEFSGEFAPSEGVVKGPEKETRKEICLNGKWDFQPIYGPYNEQKTKPYGIDADETAADLPDATADGWDSTPVKVPSAWNDNASFPSYPEKWRTAEMGWLRRKFFIPAEWKGKRIIIHFKAVSGDSKIIVNGVLAGTNFDQTIPFSLDITNKVKVGRENEIMVGMRSHSLFDWQGTYGSITAPPGGSRWYGIWQDVSLLALPKLYTDDVYIIPKVSADVLSAQVTLRNTTNKSETVIVGANVMEWVNLAGHDSISAPEVKWKLGDTAMKYRPVAVIVPAHEVTIVTLADFVYNRLKLWDFDHPNLYGMVININDKRGHVIDKKYERFGWREFKISGKNLLLNGKVTPLFGDSQHLQNTVYMTRRFAWSWFKLLKDIGANAARLHALVYPEYFHDMADEMGIALLSESSFYASTCNLNYDSKLFWKAAGYDVAGMVKAYRNHPSIYGWSIENEAVPALNVKCKDPAYKQMVYNHLGALIDSCRKYDPSRDWISGDGSKDIDGHAPVFSEHYGSPDEYVRESASTTKPYSVGEAGIAYYATPRQSSAYVGDRAYRSYKDHSDAIAIDAYELLKTERQVAAYCSVWNVGFYGVQVLPLGMTDIHHVPTKNEGIFLTAPYVEGKPGVQPERIPPYSTQYNPGYETGIPLYKPLPLYYAVKAAYQPVIQPCEWDHRQTFQTPAPPVIKDPAKEVLFIGDDNSDLFIKLKSIGIPVVKESPTAMVLVVDCSSANINDELKQRIEKSVKVGGKVIFWGLTPGNQSQVNAALPYPVEVFDRPATSLVCNESDNRVSSIPYRDLYFTENTESKNIMRYGLKGSFVNNGNVMLRACPANWVNSTGGSNNNGGMMRSEWENPAGPSFVEVKDGNGSYFASTIELERVSPAHIRMMSQLFRNLGVDVKPVLVRRGNLFDQSSVLNRTLITRYTAANAGEAFDKDFVGGEATINPGFETVTNGSTWSVAEARNGVFRFEGQGAKSSENGVVYLSFWVQSPQSLNQIMDDPNVPQVDFKCSFSGGMKLWLNGQQKYALNHAGTDIVIDKLPLIKGWNHFLIKVVQSTDNWRFTGRLVCKKYELLSAMKTAFNPYSDKANFYTVRFNDPETNYDRYWTLNGDGWYQSATPGSKAKFKFYGTGVSLYGRVSPYGGQANLYIDGKLVQVIDYKRNVTDPHTQLYSGSGFKDGEHEVTVEVIKGPATVGPYDQWESYK